MKVLGGGVLATLVLTEGHSTKIVFDGVYPSENGMENRNLGVVVPNGLEPISVCMISSGVFDANGML